MGHATTARTGTRLRTAATVAALSLGFAACGDGAAPVRDTNPPPVVTEPTTGPGTRVTEPPTDEATSPDDVEDAPTEDADTDVPTTAPTDPSALPPFAPSAEPQTGEHSGEPLLPIGVRVGEHAGFERVVIELDGQGVPGWRTEYVAQAIEDGMGDQVDVDGDAVLEVRIHGTRYPEEGEDHPARHVIEGDDVVEEVHFLGTFEGITQLFIGVDDGFADYRVLALAEPARLVIDIADPDD